MRVWVEAWQIQCCGDPFEIGSSIQWEGLTTDGEFLETFLGPKVAGTVTFAEERHADPDVELMSLSGRVAAVSAVFGQFAPAASNSKMLLPVEGSGVVHERKRATGWEDEVEPQYFLGYIVDLVRSEDH